MEIQSLKYAIALEQHQNFSSASYDCSISQSALSRHIQKLEEEIGDIKIFDRSSRPITLTPAGREFLRYANEIVNSYEKLIVSMKKYDTSTYETLTVGSVPAMGGLGIYRLLQSFRNTLPPENKLNIVDRTNAELINMLANDAIDAAFIIQTPKRAANPDLTTYELSKNELALVVNEKHPLAKKKSVSIRDLSTESFIQPDSDRETYASVIDAFNNNNSSFNIVDCFRNVETILDLLSENNDLCSLLSFKLLNKATRPGISMIKIEEPIYITLALAVRNKTYLTSMLKHFTNFTLKWTF